MDAVLFAAGRGARMGALTRSTNKAALRYKKKPLICWVLDDLLRLPLGTIWITTGYCAESIHTAVDSCFKSEKRIRFSDDTRARGTAPRLIELSTTPSIASGCLTSPADVILPKNVLVRLFGCIDETQGEVPVMCLSSRRYIAKTHKLMHESRGHVDVCRSWKQQCDGDGWYSEITTRYIPGRCLTQMREEGWPEGTSVSDYVLQCIERKERVDAITFDDEWLHFANGNDFR